VTVTTNLLLGGFGLNGTTDHGSAQLWDGHTAQPIGRPLTHPGGGIECVAFSPDGSRLVTGSEDHTARIWDILPPKDAPVPPWLPDMAEAVGGLALSDSGSLDTVQPDKLNALRRQLATASGDDFWSKAGRWFFADRTTRTISPQSPVTIADNRVRDAAAAPKKSPIFDLFNSK
jgi:WD40 repeat protein